MFGVVWPPVVTVVTFNGALLTLSVADPVRMNFLCCSQCQLKLIDSSPLKPLLPSTAPLQLLPQIILLLPLLAAVVESEKAVCQGWAAARGFGGWGAGCAKCFTSDLWWGSQGRHSTSAWSYVTPHEARQATHARTDTRAHTHTRVALALVTDTTNISRRRSRGKKWRRKVNWSLSNMSPTCCCCRVSGSTTAAIWIKQCSNFTKSVTIRHVCGGSARDRWLIVLPQSLIFKGTLR